MNKTGDQRELLAGAHCAGGASEDRIRKAESDLGVEFPSQYREFLLNFGAAFGSGFDLAGLPPQATPPSWQDVVEITLRIRANTSFDRHLVYLATDGSDWNFYLDCRYGRQGPGKVLVIGPGVENEVVAESFVEFLQKAHDHTLKY